MKEMLLVIAGDIERNPGPTQAKDKKICAECKTAVLDRCMKCSECGNYSHKKPECSHTSQTERKKMDEKDWKCINCREEEVIKQCKECKLNIVGNNAFARCKKCDAIVHKQPKCSGTELPS